MKCLPPWQWINDLSLYMIIRHSLQQILQLSVSSFFFWTLVNLPEPLKWTYTQIIIGIFGKSLVSIAPFPSLWNCICLWILWVGESVISSYKQIYFCFKIEVLNLLADIWKHNHASQSPCIVCNWSNLSDSGALWPGMKPESGLIQTPSPSQHSVLTCTTGLTTSQPSPAHYSYPIQGK